MRTLDRLIRNESGVTAVTIAIMMIMFLGFAALAIDIGHLYVVKNELKNAADSGALAGARVLYNDLGTSVNTGANQVAYDAATANISDKVAVDVHWPGGNEGDVQRGHWSFATKTFTPDESLAAPDLWGLTFAELDTYDPAHPFINAVRVRARRQNTPAASFLAGIFGYTGFVLQAEAVAYIGFAGSLNPDEVNEPIAICKQSILDDTGNYSCSRGRMINSSGSSTTNTGGWTNFSQPCSTASKPTVSPLVCSSGNPQPISLGQGIGATNGMEQVVDDALIGCWQTTSGLPAQPKSNKSSDFPNKPWKLTLPVIDCPSNVVNNCPTVLGAVEVNVIWITRDGFKNSLSPLPSSMAGIKDGEGNVIFPDWVSPGGTPSAIWTSFVSNFNLKAVDGTPATPEDKTIYFLPDCTPHIPEGTTGGTNTGILAKIPKLVK